MSAMKMSRIFLSAVVLCALVVWARAESPTTSQPTSQSSFTRKEDVVYGRTYGTALTLDVLTPEKPNGYGVILVISGGWFSAHEVIDNGLARSFAGPVLDRGYTLFCVVHGSQPKYSIPEILPDISRAVRFVRYHGKEYGIDPNL